MSERFKLIAEGLEVGPLLKRILANEHLWAEHTERQNFPGSPHKETETIYLRWATDTSVYGGFYCLLSEDHGDTITKLAPEIFPLCQYVLEKILGHPYSGGDDVGRVILTRMKPGGVITEHTDEGPYADKYDRFHVCLQGDSTLYVDGVPCAEGPPGTLYWFNHKVPHSVRNEGDWNDVDRIHLIIDLVAPEYRKKRGVTFQRERAVDVIPEAMPLLEQHYAEIAHYRDIPLEVDEEMYERMDEAGILRIYTARDCGDLIGYIAFKVGPNPHYKSSLQAVQDVLYVDKTKRGMLIGKRLLEFAYGQLKAEGVQAAYQHCKARDKETVGRFMELTGHELIDLVYGKRLDR